MQDINYYFCGLEIPQLVHQHEVPYVPLFDSTQLHVRYATLLAFMFFFILHLGTTSS